MTSIEQPRISYVIPVYNEEAILRAAIVDLRELLRPLAWNYEIIIAENGSRDATLKIAAELSEQYPEVSYLSAGEPNYGLALRMGIHQARGELVICEEIDLCGVDFHQRAIDLLDQKSADLVIGSKLIAGAADERPLFRHMASHAYTGLLRLTLGFRGTDTHGLKAFRKNVCLKFVDACQEERDVFASEFVIRAYRAKARILEIPVRVMEKRPPSINLMKRVPKVLKSVAKLTWAIRIQG